MSIMDDIRLRQARAQPPEQFVPPKHEPEILYIGCSDARLDPVKDIGIKPGKALIIRNVGALVWPGSETVGAALEFFITGFPTPAGARKHIVVSGHTDCGCMKACLSGVSEDKPHLLGTVAKLANVRATVMKKAGHMGWDEAQTITALSQESVRQSVNNLLGFPMVLKAVQDGILENHGWMLNTANGLILEMNPETGTFAQMGAGR